MTQFNRRQAIIAGVSLASPLSACNPPTAIIATVSGAVEGMSLLNLGQKVAGGMALNVTSNCVYDYFKDRTCPIFSSSSTLAKSDKDPPSGSDLLNSIRQVATAKGLDFDLCRSTASAVGPQNVLNCINGEGTIWYEANESKYEINRYKMNLNNETNSFISPRVSIGIYSKNNEFLEQILVENIAIDLEANAKNFTSFLFVRPDIRLDAGLKSLKMFGYMGSFGEDPKLVISKSVDIIICPGSIYQRKL